MKLTLVATAVGLVAVLAPSAALAQSGTLSKRTARTEVAKTLRADAATLTLGKDRAFYRTRNLKVERAANCDRLAAANVKCFATLRLVPDAAHRAAWRPVKCNVDTRVRIVDGKLVSDLRDFVCESEPAR